MSSVRRPSAHRAYIRQVAKQTVIVKLQGFLFFGTCTFVEETIRRLLEPSSWTANPIRFLVVDLSLVPGVDVSSAEALIRIQRLLASKEAFLVLCGFGKNSGVGRSLEAVQLLKKENVEMFGRFSEALEWTENAYLRAYFMSLKSERDIIREIPIKNINLTNPPFTLGESYAQSPRRSQIRTAARETLSQERVELQSSTLETSEPAMTIIKAFSSYGDVSSETTSVLSPYFTRISLPQGTTLWRKGDEPDAMYIIESGVLRATYSFKEGGEIVPRDTRAEMESPSLSDEHFESMVSGAITGELSFLSGMPRNAVVYVERDAVLWKLDRESLDRLETDDREFAKYFVRLVLKAAKIEYDVLMASIATRQ